MIRLASVADYSHLTDIWLNASVIAHDFVPAEYWEDHQEQMKNIYLPSSETWIHTDNGEITGFISIVDGRHIAALFIAPVWQRKGIGRMLLDHVKAIYSCLTLAVYERNQNALAFYENQGFLVKKKEINTETGECEHIMMWTHTH